MQRKTDTSITTIGLEENDIVLKKFTGDEMLEAPIQYNHIVENPDNTFYSNPDNIILGLGDAIRRRFNVDFSPQNVPLPNSYTFQFGQIYATQLF